VLATAGHEVAEADNPDAALAKCRAWRPDVAVVHADCCDDLVQQIKADPVAFATAIVMIERPGLSPDEALAGIRRGVQDYLVEPVADGEVLTRVEAAARTKALQQELVAQGARLEALLREDALTGLSNRRVILTQLGGMVSGARRHGHPLSIAVLDLDHFKQINDTYGHKTGDEVLVAVANALRRRLRATDAVARLGGDEFAVVLLEVDAEAARTVAEALAAALRSRRVVSDGVEIAFSASIGVVQLDRDTVADDGALVAADRALYRAKHAGRDRIEVGA
jgi:two-component system cell cycle response regulator